MNVSTSIRIVFAVSYYNRGTSFNPPIRSSGSGWGQQAVTDMDPTSKAPLFFLKKKKEIFMILFVCLMPSADRFSFGFLGFLIGPLGLYVSMYYYYFQLFVCYRIPASQSRPRCFHCPGTKKDYWTGASDSRLYGWKGICGLYV